MSRHKTPNGRGLGWKPQLPDHRDAMFTYSASSHVARHLPSHVSLQNFPIWDQGQLGSCTGNGIGFAILFDAVKQGLLKPEDVPSRLMIYYGEREMEGTIDSDAGAMIRDGIKFVAHNGTCLEAGTDSWPYDTNKFQDRPPQECWQAAVQWQALKYRAVSQIAQSLRACLAEGYPIVFGFSCYEELDSQEVADHGVLPMPKPGASPLGGHCVAAVGYDDASRHFRCRNSWGEDWGDHGYFYMPYEYMIRPDLASDFWTIRSVG
jgi:C1A family cysteine protease